MPTDETPTITQDQPEQSPDYSQTPGEFPADGSSSPEAEQGIQQGADGSAAPEGDSEVATEGEDADYLPTEQEKVFPAEVYARYAKRYGYTPEEVAADPRLQRTLHDKINSDILIQQQLQQPDEVVDEESEDQSPAAAEPTAPMSEDQWFHTLDEYAKTITTPAVAERAHKEFMALWEIKDPKQQATAFGQYFGKYTTNLVNSILPTLLSTPDPQGKTLLDQYIEQKYPALGEMHDREHHATVWNRVKASDPSFAKLPAYGTAEFRQTMVDAATKLTGDAEAFQTMTFKDKKGNPLPAAENNARKYAMLAKFATGQQVNPAVVQQAVQTGKNLQRKATVQRAAGKLGSGQTKGQFQASSGVDPLRQAIEEQRRQSNPFAGATGT